MIGYLALLRFLQTELPSCEISKIDRQKSLPPIRKNWTDKKKISCTVKPTTRTQGIGDNMFSVQIRVLRAALQS